MNSHQPDWLKMILDIFAGTARSFLSSPLVWVFLGVLAAVFAFKQIDRWQEERRLAAAGMDEVDQMTGKDFEKFLEVVFRRLGYSVERTRYIGDYGADLVLVNGGVRTVVQAKRWSRAVGIKALQEVVASKGKYRCTEAIVVTNSTYTQQALELARANGVRLWSREDLIRARLEMREEAAAPVLQPSPMCEHPSQSESVQTALPDAVCVTCGKQVSEKVRQFCADHAEEFGGQVYCFEHQKVVSHYSTGRCFDEKSYPDGGR